MKSRRNISGNFRMLSHKVFEAMRRSLFLARSTKTQLEAQRRYKVFMADIDKGHYSIKIDMNKHVKTVKIIKQ